jgi:hypothetical protein
MTQVQALDVNTAAFEARAQSEGVLDAQGYFTQDDWEFELDTLQDRSRGALVAHLEKGPKDHDTAMFLKGFLMDSRTHFTPFED